MKLKIVSFRKFICSIGTLLGVIILLSLIFSNITLSYGEMDYKTVYVIQGDTLWTIAKREQICNPYYEDKDIRDIVYELKKLNHLQESNLYVGQALTIPNIWKKTSF